MPFIYLSPSTQEFNQYVTGGNEEQYMNLIADAMEPYLIASGIQFTRNTPQMTAASSIVQSNAGNYDLHLALHSNAAPAAMAGQVRGSDVYYYPTSARSRRAADIIAANLRDIYPIPSLVRTLPTTTIGEVARTRAPAVLIEFAYHDNVEDANWIKNNIEVIAQNVVLSLTEYFGIPFVQPQPWLNGRVVTQGSPLNIRDYPSLEGNVITQAQNGDVITVVGEWQGWYVVHYNGRVGYASADYIDV
ncbi:MULTISPECIES: N-acetylmuramoyl-L-alanine amidase [unclassified Clostridium]|jgi:N-acetylmuramoyl-L-alanine amidase|uniref:N-acetylmuramoyl-L-alanine amidase n=1 Tax=Clostridia TaxID=186801 RepID=UPI001105EFD9|nr:MULTISPECIES: N-acetylmuramoyl-L-alanine amidase [unclassified Clostridium]